MKDPKDIKNKIEMIAEVLEIDVITAIDYTHGSLIIKYHIPNLQIPKQTASKFITDCEWIRPYGILFEYIESEKGLKNIE